MTNVEWNEVEGRELIADFAHVPGGLLPALHAIQTRFGHVSEAAIAVLAQVLNLSSTCPAPRSMAWPASTMIFPGIPEGGIASRCVRRSPVRPWVVGR
jgi:hypothetical protein